MSVSLELPKDLEAKLRQAALDQGVLLPDYIVHLLTQNAMSPSSMSGRDLVAYWEREGLIGARTEIQDSQVHARALRSQAERRDRS
jgi:hypothetical protein